MRVLFLCGVFAKENEDEVIAQAKKSVEFSANQMQLKLIHGFNMVADTQVISAPFLGHYPNQSRSPYFYGFANAQTLCKYVHFNNIWGYRNLSRAHSLKKAVRSFAFAEDDEKLIVVYRPVFSGRSLRQKVGSEDQDLLYCSRSSAIYES